MQTKLIASVVGLSPFTVSQLTGSRVTVLLFAVAISSVVLSSVANLHAQDAALATPLWFKAPTPAATARQTSAGELWFQPDQEPRLPVHGGSRAPTALWLDIAKSEHIPQTHPMAKLAPEADSENRPFWMHTLESETVQRAQGGGRPVVAAAAAEYESSVARPNAFWSTLPSPAAESESPTRTAATQPPLASNPIWAKESQTAHSGTPNFDDLVSQPSLDDDATSTADPSTKPIVEEQPADFNALWWDGETTDATVAVVRAPEAPESPSIEQLIRSAQFTSQLDHQASPSDAPAITAPPIKIVMDEDDQRETSGQSSSGRISDSDSKSLLLDAESMVGRGSGAIPLFGRLEVDNQFRNNSQWISTSARVSEMQVEWMPFCYSWISPVFYHKPLYFEQPNLERYGIGAAGVLQPLISSAHFFGSIPLVPYKTLTHHPREKVYTLGHGRPGNCVPVRRRVLLGESTVGEGLLFWDKCSGYAE